MGSEDQGTKVCQACRSIPPVVAEGYVEKGKWETVGGLKTYITGPADAKKGILDIYDIFGFAPQIVQGADALAAALGVLVFVPDFLEGDYAKAEWFANPSPENTKLKGELFGRAMKFEPKTKLVMKFIEDVKTKWSIEKWAALGLCWGGKVVALSSGFGTPFSVSGQVHPGRLDVEDIKKIGIPHIILASKDEDASEVAKCKEALEGKSAGVVETYAEMNHGWMGARANLSKSFDASEYERGYNQIVTYFAKSL